MINRGFKLKKESFIGSTINIIKEYKQYFIIGFIVLLVVYSFLYGIWRIPVIDFGINRQTEIGFLDYLFIIIIAILSSLFFIFLRYERHNGFASHSATGITGVGVTGVVSTICPVCQSIAFVGLGSTFLDIPTGFLTPYLGLLKILTVGLLGLGVFLKADSIYNKNCRLCEVKNISRTKNIEVIK